MAAQVPNASNSEWPDVIISNTDRPRGRDREVNDRWLFPEDDAIAACVNRQQPPDAFKVG